MLRSPDLHCLLVISLLLSVSLAGCSQQDPAATERDANGRGRQSASSAASSDDQPAETNSAKGNPDTTDKENSGSAAANQEDKDAVSQKPPGDANQPVRQWLTQLAGEDAVARNRARQQLDEQGVEDQVFVTLMKDPAVAVRHGAIYYLTGRFVIQDMALQQAFLGALRDENAKVRALALQMVARIPAETIRPAIPQLVAMLNADTEDEQNRARAARFLGRLNIEWKQVLPALTESVKTDPAEAVRKASLFGVSRMALPREAVPIYRHVLSHDKDPGVRRSAVIQLGKLGHEAADACPELGLVLQEKDEQLSDAAAQALARIGPRAVPELVRQVSSSVPRARRLAIFSIGMMGPQAKSAIPVLKKCLQDDDAEIRRLAEKSLRRLLFVP